MAAGLEPSYNTKELHYQGEPQSLVELESIPHLHSRAEAIRKVLHANKTLRDIDKQNKQDYENLVSLCNSDLLFYLKITNQYYLLSTLFKDPKVNSKWAHFINESRYQHQQRQQLEQASVFKVKASVAAANGDLSFSWSHPDPSLSNIEKLVHYSRELERITAAYHNAQANVYSRGIDENIVELNNIIVLMDRNGVDISEINRVKAVREQLVQRRYDAMAVLRQDGSYLAPNAPGADIAQIYQDSKAAVSSSLNHLNSRQREDIAMRAKAIDQRVIKNNNMIHRNFSNQAHELNAAFNKIFDMAKVDINNVIGSALDKLQHIDLTKLTLDQRKMLDGSLEKIQKLQQDITSLKDFSALPVHLMQCINIIKNLDGSIPVASNSLKTEVAVLERFVDQLLKHKQTSNQTSTANWTPQPNVNALHSQSTPQAESSAPPLVVLETGAETNHLEPEVSVLDGNTASSEPDAPPLEVKEGATLPEPSAPSLEAIEGRVEREVLIPGTVNNNDASASLSVSAAINMTKQIKFNLHSQKELGGASEELGLLLNKDNINRVFGGILKKIENAQMKKRLSPDDMLIAQQIKTLINEVKSDPDYQNSLDKIQEIHSKVNELGAACEYLEGLNESIEPISEYISHATEHSSSVSMYQK